MSTEIKKSTSANFEQMAQFDASPPAETIAVIVRNKEICFVFIDSNVQTHLPSRAFVMMYFPNRKLS